MKSIIAVATLVGFPIAASAAGIDLSWNDCVGGPAAADGVSFTCAGTADETQDLFLCFKSDRAISSSVAYTARIDFLPASSPAALRPFWHYEPGGCQSLGGPIRTASPSATRSQPVAGVPISASSMSPAATGAALSNRSSPTTPTIRRRAAR